MGVVEQEYLGKPLGVLELSPGKRVTLDASRFIPRFSGSQDVLSYLHIDYTLIDSTRAGRLTYKIVREPFKGDAADDTAYEDIDLMPGFPHVRKTLTWWEEGEAKRPLHVELEVFNAHVKVTTRYTKHRTIQ